MEPAQVTADEIIAQPSLDLHPGDSSHLAADLAGEDVEPPYLRLRTLVDESQVQDPGNQHTPVLDLTEFAALAENTGVEVVRRDAPPLPRTLIADVASFPHAMPTAIEPTTELVVPAKSLSFSRTRLVGWGSAAFCAGLLASAAAHMLMAPAHLGPTANAATVSPSGNAASTVASTAPAASAPVALAAPAALEPTAPAPAAQVPVANELAPASAQNLAAPALPTAVRTRSGAAARGQMRARGKMRSRAASAAAAGATEGAEGDWKPEAASNDDAPAAAPAARHGSDWVDPFAQ